MAYDHRAAMTNRSPIVDHEHRPSPWAQRDYQTHHRHSSSYHSLPINNFLEPESEDSDVSITDGDYSSSFSFPINLPPAPSKPALDNQDTITAHLKELERVEAHNVRKHERLKEKRLRKDEKIARKRAVQDEKIKAIMEARTRRDSRINQRRQRENIAFQRFYEDLDEEETRLQTRLKRLKRGHLVEEPAPSNRRVSMNSMSPSTPSYSTVPPPAKRHQTSHPAHTETLPPYQPPAPHQPSYQFHPPPTQHASTPYHPGPHYQSPSYGPSPTIPSHSRMGSNLAESRPHTTNGQINSPPLAAPTSTPTTKPASAPLPNSQLPSVSTPLPPRPSNATYDTRPPPALPHPSSFAAVNHPTSSGFAAVNSAPPAVPALVQTPVIKEEPHKPTPRAADQTPARTSSADEKHSAGGSAANKRTPSTTHPYQMSEAFANRHHHCERTDSLNRGIWTWVGLHGSKDHPTEPPTEMYLVCNHDGCRRIDWRTVHGLQCHIVKNHEQPKGTIGSLEKALAAYGVPVREIEEYERQHGPGTGGTMADPKNSKVRTKVKDLIDRRELSERENSVPGTGSLHLQKQSSYGSDSPHMMHVPPNMGRRKRSHSFDEQGPESGSESTPIELHKQPPSRNVSGFQAINATWSSVNATPSKPPQPREWPSNSAVVPDKSVSPHMSQLPAVSGVPKPFWSSWQAKSEPVSELSSQPTNMLTSHNLTPAGIQNSQTSSTLTRPADRPKTPITTETPPNVGEVKKSEVTQVVEVIKPAESPIQTRPEGITETGKSESRAEAEDVAMTDAAGKQSEDTQQRPSSSISTVVKTVELADNYGFSDEAPRNHTSMLDVQRNDTPRKEISRDNTPKEDAPQVDAVIEDAPRSDIPEVRQGDTARQDPQTPSREDQDSSRREFRKETRSPEMSHKRIPPPKRESRRSSMAATAVPSSKTNIERSREDDVEATYTANTASKAESVDDDSDSITVNLVPNADRRGERERERESDRTKTPVRLANGRFSRSRRMRG